MSKIITFAANNELFRKRKRIYRACEGCKKRRKRCSHTFDDENTSFLTESNEHAPSNRAEIGQSASSVGQPVHAEAVRFPDSITNHSRSSASPSKFIGFLRPEAALREGESDLFQNDHECGYWMQLTPEGGRRRSATRDRPLSPDERALDSYLAAVDVSLLPPKSHLDSLLRLYFSHIHPILPIVDQERPGRRNNGTSLSPMLLQAICIVVSRYGRARPHLVLSAATLAFEPREFAKRLYKSINAALNAKLERDRVVLIQVHTLLSLYVEGPDGAEQASLHLSQAIHGAHTLGMQFGQSRADNRAEHLTGLFWCMWGLDKLNSTIAGRPVQMHDRDHRLDSPLSNPKLKYTAFGIWLRLASELDHVITYYRPNNDPSCTGWEEDFPGLESIVGESADELNPTILTALELFYHAAASCSHKSRPITEPVSSTPSYVRQSLSTVRIIQILNRENPDDLAPLPIVPWALSLAMANAYRQFRQSKLPSHRIGAHNDLQTCCELLHKLRNVWWSAGAMEDLGRAALKQASQPRLQNLSSTRVNMAGEMSLSASNDDADLEESRTGNAIETATAVCKAQVNANDPSAGLSCESGTTEPIISLPDHSVPGFPLLNTNDSSMSPDWLNFDYAFENFDAVLGNSGADLSMELLKPFNFEDLGAFGMTESIP